MYNPNFNYGEFATIKEKEDPEDDARRDKENNSPQW